MAIFNMIGGGGDSGSSGDWTLKFSGEIPVGYTPLQDSSEYFGYVSDDTNYALPAYCYNKNASYIYYMYYEVDGSVEHTQEPISGWRQSSTSYAGMSPTPTKAPSASGSVYYFSMPTTDYGYAGTWAWVYDSSSNWIGLYQWEDGFSGSSDKNIQTSQSTERTNSTLLTVVNSMTCSTTGTYDVYWACNRTSTSGTWSSRLYINGTAYGSVQSTWSNHVQIVHLTDVSIGANDTVAVYVQSRGSTYYGYCPQLTIVQT